MSKLFLSILNGSISASWLILAVLLLRFVLHKAPRWIHVLLWGMVAIRLLSPFSLQSPWSLIPSAQTVPLNIEMDATPAIHSGIQAFNHVVNPVIASSLSPGAGDSANPLQIWIPIASVLWIAGVAALLLYSLISYLCLCRRMDTAVVYKDNIYQSEHVESPFVLGMFRPRIYIPFHMDERDLEYVVAHEQAHIRRKDHWWKPLGFLLLTVHWFNPLMWLAYGLLCRDIEIACDEKVIRALDSEGRAEYSQALVNCSVNRRKLAACPLAFGEVGVKQRVQSVMHYKRPAFWILVLAAIACLAVAVCFLTNPIVAGDHFVLVDADTSGGVSNSLTYDIALGDWAQSGTLYAEQWVNGACVRSQPIVMTQYVDSISISMHERRQDQRIVGTEIQVETNQFGGSLLSYFVHPKDRDWIGWAFTGYELDQTVQLQGRDEVILAAKVFDSGSGVRAFDCDTLASEPERLRDAEYMIVVRAVFSDDPLSVTQHAAEASLPVEVLTLPEVIALSKKGDALTWGDFEDYDYMETGSGLYIRVYKIDERFELWIGGTVPKREAKPMYIYLTLTGDLEPRIDIREGGVEAFISEHSVESVAP